MSATGRKPSYAQAQVADLRTTLFARRVSGHIRDGGAECLADYGLAKALVPEFGHEVIDRLWKQRAIRPRVGAMQVREVFAELPDHVMEPVLPSIAEIGSFGHAQA